MELVRKLDDPHIVKIVKAYNHGGTFNIVMPCAKSNLGRFLREDASDAVSLYRNCPIEQCPVWEEFLGITKALQKIQESPIGNAEGPTQKVRQIRCHFDIKPENILVGHDNLF